MRLPVFVFAILALALIPARPYAQEIRGRVVDQRSRQPLADTDVALRSGDALLQETATGADGFFRFRVEGPGRYVIEVMRAAYAPARYEVAVTAADVTVPAIVLAPQVFELDSIAAEAKRAEPPPAVGMTRASHIVAGARLALVERHGGTVYTAIRELSGLRIEQYADQFGRQVYCVESRRRMVTFNEAESACHWVVLVIDGIVLGSDGAEQTLRGVQLQDFESVEYSAPAEAAKKYGMEAGTNGALVLWTRGRGPHASEARNR